MSVSSIAAVEATGFSSVAATTWLAWDWVINASDEVSLIWERPNGWFRWLYVFIRYVPLLTATVLFAILSQPDQFPGENLNRTCGNMTIIEACLQEAVTIGVEIVLLVRVFVLYNRRTTVLVLLLALLAASIVATGAAMYFASATFTYDGQCIVTSDTELMLVVWLSPVAFDTVLFAMTAMKFGQSRMEGLGKRPILDTMVWDGTWAFILALAVMILNALVYTRFSDALSGVAYFWALSVLSFVGSHVLLNLRRLGSEPRSSWGGPISITEICFEDIELSIPSFAEQ